MSVWEEGKGKGDRAAQRLAWSNEPADQTCNRVEIAFIIMYMLHDLKMKLTCCHPVLNNEAIPVKMWLSFQLTCMQFIHYIHNNIIETTAFLKIKYREY